METFGDTAVAFGYKSNFELRRAYFLFKSLQNSFLFKAAKNVVSFCFRFRLPVSWIVKPTVFRQFCGGTSIDECLPIASSLQKFNVKAILDFSAEDGSNDTAVNHTMKETLRSIDIAATHPNIAFAVFKPTAFCSDEVLEKMSSGNKVEPKVLKAAEVFRSRVDMLCLRAYEKGVPIMIDAEDYAFQPFVDLVVDEMMEKYNIKRAIVYNTLQMYRTDRLEFLAKSLEKAKHKGYFLGMKLVRGAYMERERERAERMGYASPIWPDKQSTDKAYDEAQKFCVENIDRISLFSGTHNENSCAYLMKLMKEKNLPNNYSGIYFSQLYGMSDHISFALARDNYNVAKYIPYGPVRKVLPYLIRRAEENSSVAGQTDRELQLICSELNRRKKAS